MYHSITFGDCNTWDDWHLVPSTRPVINPPSVKQKIVDIPGGDSVLDLSESLTGYPVFNNREGTLDFIVMNDYGEWHERYSEIMAYLHGRTMRAILEDDPDFYYEGRFAVNQWKSDRNFSRISIDYSVKPYKRSIEPISKSRYAEKYVNLSIPSSTGYREFTFTSEEYGLAPVNPSITVVTSSNMGVEVHFYNTALGINHTQELSDGTFQPPEWVMYGPEVRFLIKTLGGTGVVSFEFTPGRL